MKKPLAGLEKNTLRDMGNKTAYKGFDKDFKCRDFQFEVGKEYVQEGEIIPCKNGFHACENPLDVLDYYSDIDGKYCIVEQGDEIKTEGNKIVSSKIKIKTEIGFVGLFKAGIEWIKEKTTINLKQQELLSGYAAQIGSSGDAAKIGSSGYAAKIGSSGNDAQIGSSGYAAKIGSSGYAAQIGSSGYAAQIGSSGDAAQIGSSGNAAQIGSSGDAAKIGSSGNAAQIGSSGDDAKIGSSGNAAQIGSSGDDAQIASSGKNSVICCAGHNSMAKAKIGSWITLSEWEIVDDEYKPICVKTEYVDGANIKEDTWYKLINGKFIEQDGD